MRPGQHPAGEPKGHGSRLMPRQKLIELLRWIAVLPVAWLAGLVGDALTYGIVVFPLMSGLSYEGFDRWLRHLIGRFLGGAAFVVAGARTAPRFPLATAIVLAAGPVAFDFRTHWGDTVPVVTAAVAAIFGLAVSVGIMKAQSGARTWHGGFRDPDSALHSGDELGAKPVVVRHNLARLDVLFDCRHQRGPWRRNHGDPWAHGYTQRICRRLGLVGSSWICP